MTTKPDHILIIKLGALGDFIQSLGPMRAIRKAHKDAHITLLTTAPFKQFALECGYVDTVLLDTRPKLWNIKGWLTLKNQLNSANLKRVYDLQNNDRTSFYFKLLTPKPEWVGVAKGASHRNTSPERTKGHAYDGHVQTLGLVGIENITIDTLEWMKGDLSAFALKKPYCLLIPGCAPNRPEKRWPAEHYARAASILYSMGVQSIIIGGKAESAAAQTIKESCPAALDLTNQTSLQQITALARGAIGAIGNDTGPMHIIGPTGCSSLILFSKASNPLRHAPKGANITTIQKDDLAELSTEDALNKFAPLIEISANNKSKTLH